MRSPQGEGEFAARRGLAGLLDVDFPGRKLQFYSLTPAPPGLKTGKLCCALRDTSSFHPIWLWGADLTGEDLRWAKTGRQGCASQPALPRSSPLPQATFWIFPLPDALSHTQARLAIPLQAMGLTIGGPHIPLLVGWVDAIPDSMQFGSMVCHSHEAGHPIQPEKGDIYMLCLFYYY